MSHLRHPSSSRHVLAFAALALCAFFLAACGGGTAEPAAEGAAAEAEIDTSAAAADDAIEYEPAYPEEVSAGGLAESDAAQQQEAHTHGDETHVHEGEDHPHEDDGHSH